MGTKERPSAFACYHNAEPNEPMFILLARDERAPGLVEEWCRLSEQRGTSQEKIDEAYECAAAMRAYRSGREHAKAVDVAEMLRHAAGYIEGADHDENEYQDAISFAKSLRIQAERMA